MKRNWKETFEEMGGSFPLSREMFTQLKELLCEN